MKTRITKMDGETFRDTLRTEGNIDGWTVCVWDNSEGEPYATAYDETGREHHLHIDTGKWSGCTYDYFGRWPKHQFPLAALRRLARHNFLRCDQTVQLPGGSLLGSVFI